MDFLAQIAEEKIQQALAAGEFDDLPGKGRPLELDDPRTVPDHLRVAYTLLKNAGFLPEEMQLRKDLATLRELFARADDPHRTTALQAELNAKELHYALLMERHLRQR